MRERWLADPRFLQRLAIEESISITTTLFAQYQRRGDRFWHEMEYVITDSVRGAVVDFFTVWLPAPTLSFSRTLDSQVPGGAFEGLAGLLGSVPDNAFQRARVGESYDFRTRGLAVLLGGLKLFGVGFVSSIGTLSVSNGVWALRQAFNRELSLKPGSAKRSPMFKTAFVYGGFLGLSANLRYQVRLSSYSITCHTHSLYALYVLYTSSLNTFQVLYHCEKIPTHKISGGSLGFDFL